MFPVTDHSRLTYAVAEEAADKSTQTTYITQAHSFFLRGGGSDMEWGKEHVRATVYSLSTLETIVTVVADFGDSRRFR